MLLQPRSNKVPQLIAVTRQKPLRRWNGAEHSVPVDVFRRTPKPKHDRSLLDASVQQHFTLPLLWISCALAARLQAEEVWRKLIMLFQFLRTSSSYKSYRTLANSSNQLTNSWLRS
ncbi:uncharacterized protein ACIQIH_016687 [Cyanocitta cristata]